MAITPANIFLSIIIFTVFQRIYELFLSKSNEKFILSKGGKIIKEKNYIFMVLLHTSWLLILLFSALNNLFEYNAVLFYLSLFFFITGQILRVTAIKTLGKRWSTRIAILPEAPVIKSGIFKLIRHPNYLGVVLEILFLPLMGGLIKTALSFTLINFIILFFRIKFEEKMLIQHNDYASKFNITN